MSVEKDAGNGTARLLRVLRYISFANFAQILEVLRDFHRLFGSRNSPTTGILHTVRHVYRSMWPAREAKPRFGAALECSAHDCETRLLQWDIRQTNKQQQQQTWRPQQVGVHFSLTPGRRCLSFLGVQTSGTHTP